ncbi:MAG TPA: TetR family transcriptional regulator [Actinomycetes bacterium]|nr:TetR family transcriptional regulator [Actinomycetes bacterium]
MAGVGTRGRRPGGVDTRAEIVTAARQEFAEKGYDGVTLRGIARVADVDPALVHHYFANGKEELFVAAMQLPFSPAERLPDVLAGGVDGLGERMTRFFLSVWGDPRGREPFLAVLRAALTNEQAAAMLRGFVAQTILSRVAAALDVPPEERELRVEVAAAQLIGVAMLRYVIRIEPLASATDEDVVALVAPTLQRYLTPDP